MALLTTSALIYKTDANADSGWLGDNRLPSVNVGYMNSSGDKHSPNPHLGFAWSPQKGRHLTVISSFGNYHGILAPWQGFSVNST